MTFVVGDEPSPTHAGGTELQAASKSANPFGPSGKQTSLAKAKRMPKMMSASVLKGNGKVKRNARG